VSRRDCRIQGHTGAYIFVLELYSFSSHTYAFDISQVNLCVWCEKGVSSFFCTRRPGSPSISCWRSRPFPIDGTGTGRKSVALEVCVASRHPFHLINLHPYPSSTLFWLLWLCNKFWNQDMCVLWLFCLFLVLEFELRALHC
jgi:hypothetical protein